MQGLRPCRAAGSWALVALLWMGQALPLGAQTYDISWWTVDGGGAMDASGGSFDAGVTAGGATLFADLSVTKTDGQSSSVPGMPVTYTIVVTNAGPDPASGAVVFDAPPPVLSGVSWTCSASPGSSCPASGTGAISHTVSLQPAGTATYALTGTLDPSATGTLANTAAVTAPAGVSDVNPGDNSATDADTLTPEADVAVVLSDSVDPAGTETGLTYTLQVTNAGPSTAASTVLTDALPSGVGFVSSTPGAPACTEAAGTVTCTLPGLPPAASSTVSIGVVVRAGATGTLVDSASVTGSDPDPDPANNGAIETTQVFLRPEGELVHGARQSSDLGAVGGAEDLDYYRIAQRPHASYEVLVDAATGDLGPAGPALERIVSDGVTVLQSSVPSGAGSSRSLRWINAGPGAVTDEYVRLRSLGCGADCTAEDRYRLRAWETTGSIARLNNTATQTTVVLLQNVDAEPLSGRILFWSAAGVLLHEEAFSLAPHGQLVFNSGFTPALAGQSGSITVVHDGRLGALSGKAIGLEPATGFTFDTPLLPRPR